MSGDRADSGTDHFVQAIFPHLLQVSTNPQSVKLPHLRRDSPVWQWLEIAKPEKGHRMTVGETLEPMASLFEFLGQQRHRQEMARYMLARMLRQEYGLNRGRKVVPGSSPGPDPYANSGSAEPDSYRDTAAETGFANIDDQVLLQNLLAAASPAQMKAAQAYYAAAKSSKPVADVCRDLGLDPNLVRNNFQAFRRKAQAKLTDH